MGQGNNRPNQLVTDLWLVVEEEQTLHYGLRRAWRWLEHEQNDSSRERRTQQDAEPCREEGCKILVASSPDLW